MDPMSFRKGDTGMKRRSARVLCAANARGLLPRILLQLLLRVPFYGSILLLAADVTVKGSEWLTRGVLFAETALALVLLVLPGRFCFGRSLRRAAEGERFEGPGVFFRDYGLFLKASLKRLLFGLWVVPFIAAAVYAWDVLRIMPFNKSRELYRGAASLFVSPEAGATEQINTGVTVLLLAAAVTVLIAFAGWQLRHGAEQTGDCSLRVPGIGKQLKVMAGNALLWAAGTVPALVILILYFKSTLSGQTGAFALVQGVLSAVSSPIPAGVTAALTAVLLLLCVPLRLLRDARTAVFLAETEERNDAA